MDCLGCKSLHHATDFPAGASADPPVAATCDHILFSTSISAFDFWPDTNPISGDEET